MILTVFAKSLILLLMNETVIVQALRSVAASNALASLGILLLVGYMLGKLAGKLRLPEITGFILAGLFIGRGGLNVLPVLFEPAFMALSKAALTLIAFTIGAEFFLPKVRRIGFQVAVMGVIEVVASMVLVTLVMRWLGLPWPFALVLGAIAAATAPAATVAIVQSLRARGRYIDMLYGLVALDDVAAVIIFAVVFAFAGRMLEPGLSIGIAPLLGHALLEIVISVLKGGATGLIICRLARKNPTTNEALIGCIGLLLLLGGVAQGYGYSLLLAGMAAGAVYVNCAQGDQRLFHTIEPLTPPLYALFFVIAGTELQPAILLRAETLLLGMGYVVARGIGKYGGIYAGATLTHVEPNIRNYMGLSMLPQAGVALGLVLLVRSSPWVTSLPDDQQIYVSALINVVLFSVLFSELVGPPISRYAIIHGNDMEESWNS